MMNANVPAISVIVPVFNVEAYLERCLDSLMAQVQTFDDFEIICIDDASTDGSLQLLERYAERHADRLRVLRNERNRGLGATRDVGMQAARGEYLAFVDSDDWVDPDYLRTYASAMEAAPCDILIGGYVLDRMPGAAGGVRSRSHVRFFPHSDWTLVLFSAAWGKLFRRAFVVQHRLVFSAIRYAEDTYLALCAFCVGARCGFVDYAGYHYQQTPHSLTRGRAAAPYERELAALYDAVMERYDMAALPPARRHMLACFYVTDMLNALLVFGRGCGVRAMKDKLRFFVADLRRRFPAYRQDPYLKPLHVLRRRNAAKRGWPDPSGMHRRARVGLSIFSIFDRLGLRALPFYAAAMLKR